MTSCASWTARRGSSSGSGSLGLPHARPRATSSSSRRLKGGTSRRSSSRTPMTASSLAASSSRSGPMRARNPRLTRAGAPAAKPSNCCRLATTSSLAWASAARLCPRSAAAVAGSSGPCYLPEKAFQRPASASTRPRSRCFLSTRPQGPIRCRRALQKSWPRRTPFLSRLPRPPGLRRRPPRPPGLRRRPPRPPGLRRRRPRPPGLRRRPL